MHNIQSIEIFANVPMLWGDCRRRVGHFQSGAAVDIIFDFCFTKERPLEHTREKE